MSCLKPSVAIITYDLCNVFVYIECDYFSQTFVVTNIGVAPGVRLNIPGKRSNIILVLKIS